MPNSWFRLWHDMPNDPKWRTIARISGEPITAVISVALHLMVSASLSPERGVTRCDAEDVASALDLKTEQVEAIFGAMQGRIMDGPRLTGWEKRQPEREDSSASRTKQWRERKKTQCDAPVTHSDAPDTDKEEKKKVPKPSTPKPRGGEKASDPRHSQCRAVVDAYWSVAYPEERAPWDGAEAGQLSRLLKAMPRLTVEEFCAMVQNRADSEEINHSEPPRLWLGNLARYRDGPLTKYQRPQPQIVVRSA